jgi:outer membrane receptor for ferrienterochelin and colicin
VKRKEEDRPPNSSKKSDFADLGRNLLCLPSVSSEKCLKENLIVISRLFQILSSLVLFLIVPVLAAAQTGTITGMVVDQISQEPLPSANIQVLGTTLGASADVDGRFSIRGVPFGTVRVRASLVGYRQEIQSDVIVAAGRAVQLMFKLDQVPVGIGAVEVTAGYFQKNPDAPVSTQRLSAEEIRRSPGGFEDVLRAIAVLPGVSQVDAGRTDLVVRGGAPSENLYVVDNIEIPNINHYGIQGSGGGSLSYINLDFVRETAFSTGGFGVKYGGRMSSVLRIDMRDGRSDRVGGKGTISATQFGLNLEGPLDQNGTFIFSARRSYLDFIFKAAGFNFVPEYWDFLGRLAYRLDQRNSLSLLGIGAIDDVSFFNDDAEKRYENSRILGTAQKQYAGGVSWEHLCGRGVLTVTLGRSFVRYNGVQNDSLLRPIFSNTSQEGETNLRADLVVKMTSSGEDEASFGIQMKRVGFGGGFALPEFRTTFGDSLSVDIRGAGASGHIGSAYVQVLHHWPWDIQLVLGARADYFDMISRKYWFSPRASITWDATQRTSVNASAGSYRQFPSLVWLLADERNRELKAVRADQYILGVEHLLREDLEVRLEAFLKEYRDYPASVTRPYLVLANTGVGYGGSEEGFASYGLDYLVSEGRGASRGLEFLLQKKLGELPLYGILSVSWSRTRFTALDGVERPGAFDQRLVISSSGGYKFDERWEASMRFRYASGRPLTPFNPDGTQDVNALYSERLKAFHALDLRVDRRWNFERWNLIVYLDIQNVYNNRYVSALRWNAREQRVEGNQANIGIIPSIGVSAEF